LLYILIIKQLIN